MKRNIRQMKETDVDCVYEIETTTHITPWAKSILRDCVLIGYDCRVLELSQSNKTILGGYFISRIHHGVARILNFCIKKPLQSQGLGRFMLQEVISQYKQNPQLHSITLEVRSSNKPALHLYTSIGFKEVEVKKEYYKDENNVEDAIVFNKKL